MAMWLLVLSLMLNGNHCYPKTARVTQINYRTETVTVTDYNGNDWEFIGIEDYAYGDVVSMLMSDSGTESIYDDVILYTRYGGR